MLQKKVHTLTFLLGSISSWNWCSFSFNILKFMSCFHPLDETDWQIGIVLRIYEEVAHNKNTLICNTTISICSNFYEYAFSGNRWLHGVNIKYKLWNNTFMNDQMKVVWYALGCTTLSRYWWRTTTFTSIRDPRAPCPSRKAFHYE